MNSRYFTVTEAAAVLKVSHRRVVQLVHAGILRADRVPVPGRSGFMYLIPKAAVNRRARKKGK